jgi:protein-tyrosine-phosphatase
MAAAIFNQLVNPRIVRAISAGTRPAKRIHPQVVTVMREMGINLVPATPRLFSPSLTDGVQLLITMGCGDACPSQPSLPRDEWALPDPAGQPIDRVRQIRDEIARRVRNLVAAQPWD